MNNLVIISGPSGSGKSTLVKKLIRDNPGIAFSVSHTTRPPREGETEGRDYHFVSRERFLEMIKNDSFLEWAEVHRNLYGTTRQELEEKIRNKEFVILDIDVQGAKNLLRKLSAPLSIFVLPPSVDTLRDRLKERRTENHSTITLRLKIALEEIRHFGMYDFVVFNDKLETAYSTLKSILLAHQHKVSYNKDRIEKRFNIK
jgi:guanylate kinase